MKQTVTKVGVLCFLGLGAVAYGQQTETYKGKVGINTEQPSATLHIQPNAENGKETATTNEGIIAPKLSKTRVAAIARPIEGTQVYVTDDTASPIIAYTGKDAKVAKITEKGYYFYNGTEWVKTSVGADGDAIWIKDGNDAKLSYPKSNYTTKYTQRGGYEIYTTNDTTYPSISKSNSRDRYDYNILTEVNSFNKSLTSSSDIDVKNPQEAHWGSFNIHRIDTEVDSNDANGYNFQTVVNNDNILAGKNLRNIFNNFEHLGNTRLNNIEGTYGSAALNGLNSSANIAVGGCY